MKEIIIDGRRLGLCKGYRNRNNAEIGDAGAWVFYMAAGYFITVEKRQIKMFTSCEDLTITLYPQEVTA